MKDANQRYAKLGRVAERKGEYERADFWYQSSISTDPSLNSQQSLSFLYDELAKLAHARGDFAATEFWYVRVVETEEKLRNWNRIAGACGQIGVLKGVPERFCGRWSLVNSIGVAIQEK
jgi:hypothetical protein